MVTIKIKNLDKIKVGDFVKSNPESDFSSWQMEGYNLFQVFKVQENKGKEHDTHPFILNGDHLMSQEFIDKYFIKVRGK